MRKREARRPDPRAGIGWCSGAPRGNPSRGPSARARRKPARLLLVGVSLLFTIPACKGGDESTNDNHDPNYYSYYVENVHYDAENDRVTVSGLYYPQGFVEGCSLPVSEVRHEFSFSDEGWVTYEAATPLQEGFGERVDSLRQAHPTRWEVSIPGRGRLWIGHSPFQHPQPGALVLPCSTMGLMSEDATETTHYIELRCGFCVEHGCGNDICDPGEDWTTCQDCEEPPVEAVCGDGSCDGTELDECRPDCGCTNDECDQQCTTGVGAVDYGFCGATDSERWIGCSCGVYNTPCDGSEPFCDPNDPLGDVVFVCEPAVSARVRFGCNQLCWEAFGTSGGSCDAGGTGDCVCEGGLAPW